MKIIQNIISLIIIAVKRFLARRSLVLASMLGIAASLALGLSIPLYADAVYYRIFEKNLSTSDNGEGSRPPFTFIYHFNGGRYGSRQWEDLRLIDDYFDVSFLKTIGLPPKTLSKYFRTEPFKLFSGDVGFFTDDRSILAWVSLGYMSDIENHITLTSGKFPNNDENVSERELDVLISEEKASELGVQVGENYTIYTQDETSTGSEVTTQFPVHVVGIWKPVDPESEYWIFNPKFLNETFILAEDTYSEKVSPYLQDEIYTALWYFVLDGSNVHANDAGKILERINETQKKVDFLLPDTSLSTSPEQALVEYQRSATILTILLFAFSVPILSLMLAFVNLVAGLAVERQRNEIAVLRSRGATVIQIIGIVMIEGVLVGLLAMLIGIPLGLQISKIIGQTRSFLDFSTEGNLRLGVTTISFQAGLVVIALAIAAQVIPVIGAARHTIVSYKQEQARMVKPPWWQRIWLDVLLIIPTVYGAYLLRNQGSLVALNSVYSPSSPFENPLLFLVPALGILTLTLFFLRLIPFIMGVIAWVTSFTKSVGLVLAARHLARTPGFYSTPLILLVLTLSLSVFTATLAQTLDDHLHDQIRYEVGADVRFFDYGETPSQGSPFAPTNGTEDNTEGPLWSFIPVTEYLKAPSVEAATRIGWYQSVYRPSNGGFVSGRFLGVDRLDFPKAAFWRSDFSDFSLGALMNNLAAVPNGILVPKLFLNENGLGVGEIIRVFVDMGGQRHELEYQIAGTFSYFPSWYPEDGPLFVGNLDYLFEEAGSLYPYRIWLKTSAGISNLEPLQSEIKSINTGIINWQVSEIKIVDEQKLPERQGLFGVLSIGFGAAAIMTVLGFLLYALFSFQRRFIELGVLRASGLSMGQMTSYLAWELIFLIGLGGVVGTGLGAWVSDFFIPFLQIGTSPVEIYPPFLVKIAWPAIFQIYGLFTILFFVTLIILVILLKRMKIFQAVKLGEIV